MKAIETIFSRMAGMENAPAVFWNDKEYSYSDFLNVTDDWSHRLLNQKIGKETICGFTGDYSLQVIALIFALIKAKAILVPITSKFESDINKFKTIAGIEYLYRFDKDDKWTVEKFTVQKKNPLVAKFEKREVPGLIVFTSGSTGEPKGILQDCELIMRKFIELRKGWRTILFLLLDHFGGFNTLLSSFGYGGTAVCLPDRSPDAVCQTIEKSRADLLPTTPTFLNLLITSRSYLNYDLSSIKLITYGTEVMPDVTLKMVKEIFPNTKLKQTYGLSELGVLRSTSKTEDSVWVKIGGSGFETKIIDNILWVRSESNMVGYLNAPNPFNEDGWMSTGDHVEVQGDYVRILGRKSDMINIGGQKVFPAEVENILLKAENIQEVRVYGIKHPIMGQVLAANVSLYEPEDQLHLTERLRKYCVEKMVKYKVPVRFKIVPLEEQYSDRFKRVRKIL